MRTKNWYNRNFIKIEFVIAVALSILCAAWIENIVGYEVLNSWLSETRKELYSTVASISGALLGFIITSVSIVIVFIQSEKLELLRQSKNYPTLYKVFIVAIKYLGFTTAVNLIGLVIDKDSNPQVWIMYLSILGVVLSVFALARCLWVLESLISLITQKENR